MVDLSGKVVDKYRLTRLLGSGGMGAVYEATHTLVGRKCAVKLLHPRYSEDEEVTRRMLREARAAAAIGHPNIVETHDFGVTPDGLYYLVMEYLSGATLSDILESQGRLDVRTASSIVSQVLHALEAAHGKGVVHRDLKPENIFVARNQLAGNVVKILDFGISKVLGGGGETSKLTSTGAVLGTPAYMSPEQAAGASDIDHRSDIWSVGVILYELLTGVLPFHGDNYNQIIVRIVTSRYRRPSELRPDLTPGTEALLVRALAREPNQRFQSANEMRLAIATHVLQADPTGGPPPLPREILDGFGSSNWPDQDGAVSMRGATELIRRPISGEDATHLPSQIGVGTSQPESAMTAAPPNASGFPPPAGQQGGLEAPFSPAVDTIGTQPRGEVSPGGAPTPAAPRRRVVLFGTAGAAAVLLLVFGLVILLSRGSTDDSDAGKHKRPGVGAKKTDANGVDRDEPRTASLSPMKPAPRDGASITPSASGNTGGIPLSAPRPSTNEKKAEITVISSVVPSHATVMVDGERVQGMPIRIVADGRQHRFGVKAKGYETVATRFKAVRGYLPLVIVLKRLSPRRIPRRTRYYRRPVVRRPPMRRRPMGYIGWD